MHCTFPQRCLSYKCTFNFDGEVLEGIIECLNRMVPDVETRSSITHEMELYQEASGLFGFANAIVDKNFLMPHKPLEFKIKILFVFYLKVGLCFDEM